jgi:hypothetical protein
MCSLRCILFVVIPGLTRNPVSDFLDSRFRENDTTCAIYYDVMYKKRLKKFPDAQGLREILEKVEDDIDDPSKGHKSPHLGLLLLMALLYKKLMKK